MPRTFAPARRVTIGRRNSIGHRSVIAGLALALTVTGVLPAAAQTPAPTVAAPPAPTAAAASPAHHSTNGLDPAVFADPGADSRPTMLWFWNGTITTALIDSQLAELRSRGIEEAVIFPFDTPNLQPAFLTDGWFDMVGHALHEAQDHGMKLWLYNDDHFPSGRAAGIVANGGKIGDTVYPAHPELRTQGLDRDESTVTGPTTISLVPSPTGLSVAGSRLLVDAARLNGVSTLKTGTTWTDYTFSADVQLQTGNAGFVVRAQDAQNGYLTDVRSDGSIEIYRQVAGAFTLLTTTPVVPGFDATAVHHLQVIVAGSTLTPVLDGATEPGVTDGTFPAGTVGVRAVATQKSLRDNWSVTAADGTSLYRQSFDDPSALADFNPSAGAPAASVVSASARPEGSADASKVIDLTRQTTGDGTWSVPAGTWTIDTFSSRYLDGDGGYLDLLNPVATQQMMNIVPGEYYRRFPWAFGTVLKGFWDDEPYIASASAHFNTLDYSPGLAQQLKTDGAALGPALTATFADLGRSGRVSRGHYWKAVSDLFAQSYYQQQGDWMAQHHVGFISNPLWDEYGPTEQVASTGDLSKDHQWAQVPGTDVIFDQYEPGGRTMLPRFPASAAHQNGQNRVLLESFGGHGWDTDPEYMQATLGAFAVRGINLNVLHALWTDPNNVVYPTQFEGINPWWNQSNPLNDWIGRIDYVASGKPVAPTALIVPEQAAQSWQDSSNADVIDAQFAAANNALEDNQSDFDLLSDAALSGDPGVRAPATVRRGELVVGDQQYRLAVLPQTPTISLATVATLTAFVRSGGTLAAVGTLPVEETGGHDAALASALQKLFAAGPNATTRFGSGHAVRVATPAGLGAVVGATGVAAASLSPAAPALRVLRVKTGSDTAFLVENESAAPITTKATFPVAGLPQLWDPRTGTISSTAYEVTAGGTAVPITLAPYETSIVVVDTKAPTGAPHLVTGTETTKGLHEKRSRLDGQVLVGADTPRTLVGQSGRTYFSGPTPTVTGLDPIKLDGNWNVQLEKAGAVATSGPLGSWTTTDPNYSGAATYQRTFSVKPGDLTDRQWTLDLGDVGTAAQVTVNGHAFAPLLWKPYAVDVTSALHAGTNTISVRVSNTLANVKGEVKASGLLGPVTLTPARWVPISLPEVARAGTVALIVPTTIDLAPGQSIDAPVTVRRYGGAAGSVKVSVSGSAGVTASLTPSSPRVGGNGSATSTLTVSASPAAAVPSAGAVTVIAGGVTYTVPVKLDLASRWGTATASSTLAGHDISTVNDGVTSSDGWDQGQGWNDATFDAYPDSATITFASPAPISHLDAFTLDSATYPAGQEGIVDADLEVQSGGIWRTVGTIRGNSAGELSATFPTVTATAVRITVLASRDHYSRLIELQARP